MLILVWKEKIKQYIKLELLKEIGGIYSITVATCNFDVYKYVVRVMLW